MSKTQRLYDFKPGTRIRSAEVDDELNRQVEAHNALDDELIAHAGQQVDIESEDTTRNKHVSNADMKSLQDQINQKGEDLTALDTRLISAEGNISVSREDITQLKANKANKTEVYERELIDGFLKKKMDIDGDHKGTWFGLKPSDVTSESINGARLDLLEPLVEQLDKSLSNFDLIKRELASFKLYQAASDRVPNGILFGTEFDDTFGMTIDFTKSYSSAALTAGATQISVMNAAGFASGQQVTVYDDVNSEHVDIIAVNGNVLTVSALLNEYKSGAGVARTMAVVDTVAKTLSFETWNGTELTYSDIRFKLDLPYQSIAMFITHGDGMTFTGLIDDTVLEEKILEGVVNVTVSEGV
ncbi:hypothetical protein KZX50_00510 [Bacillus infantis]|uniref:hypothetical protein n=1 Tax=Bacillus infantis TaxID=324767 RepID=UPI0020064FE0|nr:hypothetical protein [Bacillus infantis]MCK6203929.1 hypothetical protein [Bacillus infantis]